MPDIVGRLRAPRLAAAPANPVAGDIYFNTTSNGLFFWNGTQWVGAAGTGMIRLSDQTLGADAATISSGALPGTYINLLIHLFTRTDDASLQGLMWLTFNNDTAPNYTHQRLSAAQSTVNAADLGGDFGWPIQTAGGTQSAGYYGAGEVKVFSYASATYCKSGLYSVGYGNSGSRLEQRSGQWSGTAAITSVQLTIQNGANHIRAGSRMTIWGLG